MPERTPVETFAALEQHVDRISGNPTLPTDEAEIVSPEVARVLIRGQAQDKLARLVSRVQIPIDRLGTQTGGVRDRLVALRDAILEESQKIPVVSPTNTVAPLLTGGFRGFEAITTQTVRDFATSGVDGTTRAANTGVLVASIAGVAGVWYGIMNWGKARQGQPKQWGDRWYGKIFKTMLALTATAGVGWAAGAYVSNRQRTALEADRASRQPDIAALDATGGTGNIEFAESLRSINLGLIRGGRRLNINATTALQFSDSGSNVRVTRVARAPGATAGSETITPQLRLDLAEIRVDANGEVFLRPPGGDGIYMPRSEFLAMITGATAGSPPVQGFIQPFTSSSATRTDRRTVTLTFTPAT